MKNFFRGRLQQMMMLLALALASAAVLAASGTADPPPCPASAAISIAWADAGGPIVVTSAAETGPGIRTVTLLIRNDSPQPIRDWCLTFRFNDYLGQRITPALDADHAEPKICQTPYITAASGDAALGIHLPDAVASGGIATLPVRVTIERANLPAQGIVIASAAAPTPPPPPCALAPKTLSRPVILPAPAISWPVVAVPGVATAVGLMFLALMLFVLRAHLGAPMGSSIWAPGSSLATNLAVIGAVTSSTLTSAVIPEYPHIAPKATLTMLAIGFALAVAVAPAIYNFWSKTTDGTTYQSTVRWFVCCASLTVWGIVGEAGVLLLLIGEFGASADAWWPLRLITAGAVGFVALSAIVYCGRMASDNAHRAAATAAARVNIGKAATGASRAVAAPPPTWRVL